MTDPTVPPVDARRDGREGESGAGWTVRPMHPSDLSQVVAIEREAFTTPWSEETFRSLFHRDPWVLLVLEEEQGAGISGYAVLGCVLEQGELANIAVRSRDRGKGLGGLLLDHVVREAVDRGVQQLFLEVRVSNTAAAALYAARGFQEIGIRKNYYEEPREHARVLVRRLREPGPPQGAAGGEPPSAELHGGKG